jgi:hypothetical protein
MAPGPSVLDGEHGQRQRYHHQARPGCYQEHQTDGKDHRARDGDRNPAQQPDQIVHTCQHASTVTAAARSSRDRPPGQQFAGGQADITAAGDR